MDSALYPKVIFEVQEIGDPDWGGLFVAGGYDDTGRDVYLCKDGVVRKEACGAVGTSASRDEVAACRTSAYYATCKEAQAAVDAYQGRQDSP